MKKYGEDFPISREASSPDLSQKFLPTRLQSLPITQPQEISPSPWGAGRQFPSHDPLCLGFLKGLQSGTSTRLQGDIPSSSSWPDDTTLARAL